MESEPLVSICCVTYNHGEYISDALEGFLMQETGFPFEVLIHDDASSDKTPDIIREYEKKYPEIIKPIYQNDNQKSKISVGVNVKFNYSRAKGKYIALCEGDDYWTDKYKLQKQVDFMVNNPECSVCFHAAKYQFIDEKKKDYVKYPPGSDNKTLYATEDVIKNGGWFMTTNSILFKRMDYIQIPQWVNRAPVGDLPLMLVLSVRGAIGYINECMSTYRKMSKGSWSSKMEIRSARKKHFEKMISMWNDFNNWTDKKYAFQILIRKAVLHKEYYIKSLKSLISN